MEQEAGGKNRMWVWGVVGVVILAMLALVALLYFGKNTSVAKKIGEVLPFGVLSPDSPRGGIEGGGNPTGGDTTPTGGMGSTGEEPLFRQLTKEPVAGITTVVRDGKTYVRYVLRENGNVHEVDPMTGLDAQLTNTTVLRIYEAYFGNKGNTVVLRYLKHDPVTQRDTIKTVLGDLELPLAGGTSTVGSLRPSTEFLPDDISAVSVSPDGTHLFYLLPVPEGVSGTIVSLGDKLFPKEVLRNSFSEWLPQLFNNGTVLLSTKPSAEIPGYAYLYDPVRKTLTRLVREKNGLTTLGSALGDYVLFNENIAGGSALRLYSAKGYPSEEGVVDHETPVPLTTLPEKCAWGTVRHMLYCGSFVNDRRAQVPDDWYKGLVNFNDTFWSINTVTTEIGFIADPQKAIQRNFDVTLPLVAPDELHFFFVDKNDDSLWSMRLPVPTEADLLDTTSTASATPPLSPEEMKDAAGSLRP